MEAAVDDASVLEAAEEGKFMGDGVEHGEVLDELTDADLVLLGDWPVVVSWLQLIVRNPHLYKIIVLINDRQERGEKHEKRILYKTIIRSWLFVIRI